MAIKINISRILGEKKMTMRELSGLTGIRPTTISNLYYEVSKRIEIDQINALCKALECQVGDIFEYVED
ncbi:MAG: helix-turn-helix transcriptional regulator [Clostridia bacterium]|nr:helix-turn-helix transcriptional regulator [Oscillospiraceae bacterium]MBQ9733845.1 helix-turn-helix transcriptional regulator [Clostridia bacterium]